MGSEKSGANDAILPNFGDGRSCSEKWNSTLRSVGVVVIGRNEGARLKICLESISPSIQHVIYVDSGSTDGSLERARSIGAHVVALDSCVRFTAARARNAGFVRLLELDPKVRMVQFVDGDCELKVGWLEYAARTLEQNGQIAAVCGRLRERYPELSLYIRMCDIGWDGPSGDILACGGVAMYRADSYAAMRGFSEALIAGEEFELCSRLRAEGWRVVRIATEMALHDVGIVRFGQWWARAMRAGYAYAEGWALHSRALGKGHRTNVLRAIFWGVLLPGVTMMASLSAPIFPSLMPLAAVSSVLLTAQIFRLAEKQHRRGRAWRDALAYGVFLTVGKMPEAHGAVLYWYRKLLGGTSSIIEYR